MAENMIKFLRGNVASLPETATEGALYFTKDEGVYLGLADGSYHRYGDFITVANVDSLPAAGAHETCMYYCVAENILAKWNGSEWTQINKQKTLAELGGVAKSVYEAKVASLEQADSNNATAISNLTNKVGTVPTDKTVVQMISEAQTAAEGKVTELANGAVKNNTDAIGILNGADTVEGSVAKALKDAKGYTDTEVGKAKTDLIGSTSDTDASSTIAGAKKYADKLDAAMDTRVDALEAAIGEGGSVGAQIDAKINLLDVVDTAVDGQYVSAVSETDGKISVTRKALPDYTEVYEPKGTAATEAGKVQNALNEEIVRAKAAEKVAKDAADAAQSAADAAQSDVDALEAKVGTVPADKTVVEMISDAQTAATYDDTQIKADIKANKDAIDVLNGDGEGSVSKQVADAVAALVADAPEAYDTLKEISDWISSHTSDASAMNSQITTNKNDIAGLKTLIGTLPESATSATVVDYINEAIAALSIGDYAKAADLSAAVTRIDTAEGKITTLEGKVKALEDVGSQANIIEIVKVNGVALPVTDKAVDVAVPTGALASKDKVAESDLATDLATKINAKANQSDLDALSNKVGTIPAESGATTVIDYVDKKVSAEGVAALKTRVTTAEGKITTLEGQVATINGNDSTDGSIAKALKDANAYTNALRDGQVATNKTNIEALQTGKADKATTLAGYGITDAYTKSQTYTQDEVNALLTWGEF